MSKPLYWECNKATWDQIRRRVAPHAKSMHQLFVSEVEVRLKEGINGWNPVYKGETPSSGPCCPFENRRFSGGCLSCEDPCL